MKIDINNKHLQNYLRKEVKNYVYDGKNLYGGSFDELENAIYKKMIKSIVIKWKNSRITDFKAILDIRINFGKDDYIETLASFDIKSITRDLNLKNLLKGG